MGFMDTLEGAGNAAANVFTLGTWDKYFKPAITGAGNTLAGTPTAVSQYNMSQLGENAYAPTVAQNQYLDYLTKQAYPEGNMSVAENLLNQKTAENAAASAGLLGSARGIQNTGMIARQAANQQAALNQQAAGQGATLRAQEAQGKQEMLAKELEANRQAAMEREKTKAYIGTANATALTQAASDARKAQAQLIGGLGQAGAGLAAASDINVKKDISDGSGTMSSFLDELASRQPSSTSTSRLIKDPQTGEVRPLRLDDPITFGAGKNESFLDTLNPYEYKYKNTEKNGEGNRLGIMAQDLEKTPEGNKMVVDTKGGKKINADVSTLLAAEATNHQRIKTLEDELMKTKEAVSQPVAKTMDIPSYPIAQTMNPSTTTIPRVQAPTYSDQGLGRSYYENGQERLRVPPKEWPTYGIEQNTGEIVERGQPFVRGAARYSPSNISTTVQPTEEDITKTQSFLDLLDTMEKSKNPFREKTE